MDNLLRYIRRFVPLDEQATALIRQFAREEFYQKRELILRPGRFCDRIWFISSGMVRKYYLLDGREITTWIHTENEILTSLNSYFHQEASDEYLEASEPVKLVSISRENSVYLAENPSVLQFTTLMMGEHFARLDANSREFSQLDARSKYNFLRKTAPEMMKRASLGHIASIMGIHPSTLSRLRRKV